MKKFMLFAAAASVALVGCVNDEKMEMASEAQKISFDAPAMATQTRTAYGEITGTTYPTTEQFGVFAWQYDEDTYAWENVEQFWTGTEVWNYTSGNQWKTTTSNKIYYWPRSPWKLAFAAYSPATLSGSAGVSADYATGGNGISTLFTVNKTVNSQQDFMYATLADGFTEAANGESGVPLTFKHALSSIVFAAVDQDASASYTITSINVKGKFIETATFTEKATTQWSGTASTEAINYTPALTNFSVPTDNAKEFTNGASALLMIPQNVPDDAEVTIAYKVNPNNGATYNTSSTVKLKNFLIGDTAGNLINNWQAGSRYTYMFIFGSTKPIFFTPSVENWKQENAAMIHL